jgi:hypothetical protein
LTDTLVARLDSTGTATSISINSISVIASLVSNDSPIPTDGKTGVSKWEELRRALNTGEIPQTSGTSGSTILAVVLSGPEPLAHWTLNWIRLAHIVVQGEPLVADAGSKEGQEA